MNSQSRKKLFLGVLILPLIYIWGSNLNWFSSYEFVSQKAPVADKQTVPSVVLGDLQYSAPKINPFASNVTARTTQKSNKTEKRQKPRDTKQPSRPSSEYTYIGFIDQPPHSQAVVSGINRPTAILESGDSLISWRLVTITPELTVFQFNKDCDTLVLTK